VIARLPFSPPTHPIAEAKAELIRDRGGDPFGELTLPEAVIKFRQGVGRLIRTKADRGLITVLDSRTWPSPTDACSWRGCPSGPSRASPGRTGRINFVLSPDGAGAKVEPPK
jgi:hypothetical protein